MKKTKIEGIATISKGTFRFDSGLPSDEPVVTAQRMRGNLHIQANGSADFEPCVRAQSLPPNITLISEGEAYRLKRSSKHYLVQMKLPLVESRSETQQLLTELLQVIVGEITLDREELFNLLTA